MDEKQKSQALSALEKDLPEALEFINSSVSRMDNLINAILDLSRLERRELRLEPLNMNLVAGDSQVVELSAQYGQCKSFVGKLPECVADRLGHGADNDKFAEQCHEVPRPGTSAASKHHRPSAFLMRRCS